MSNGDDFSADDVVYTFEHVAGPNTDSVLPQSVNWIARTEKIDDHTVRLHLAKSFPAALECLSGQTPIFPEKYFQSVKLAGFSRAPIGTSTYKIVRVIPGQVDWIWRVPSDQTEAFSAMPNLAVRSGETMRVGFMAMSIHSDSPEEKPFQDVRVCQSGELRHRSSEYGD
ncbi:MAG: ABC transporter substrate-binding protein [Candidatus Malihini olakiniferum]